jgi:DtxR family Mn-dependent transcriptional regulator
VPSEAVENYLTAIQRLGDRDTPVTTSALARHLAVAPASVTGMLKKLSREGFVEYRRYRGTLLTRKGSTVAGAVTRRHRLVETFLVQALGIAPDRVHAEAHRWEHVLSDEVVERLDAWLGVPARDPHGTPIPRTGTRSVGENVLLATLPAGESARVKNVRGVSADHAAYLHALGLEPGAEVTAVARGPFGGPVTLAVAGRRTTVGPEVTHHVIVEPSERSERS